MVCYFLVKKMAAYSVGSRQFALTILHYYLTGESQFDLDKKTLSRLFEMADDPSERVRGHLVPVLTYIGKPAVPTLIKIYETDKSQRVRHDALNGLAQISEDAPDAVPLFLSGVSPPEGKIHRSARRGLEAAKPDPEQLNEALQKALASDDVTIRRETMEYVSSILSTKPDSTDLLPVVMAGIASNPPDEQVQRTASELLSRFRKFPKEVMAAIVQEWESADKVDTQRWHLPIHLFNHVLPPDIEQVVDELVKLYPDASSRRRVAILQLLGELAGIAQPALPLIEEALKDKDPQVRAAAEEVLSAIRSLREQHKSPHAVTIKITADGKLTVADKPYDVDGLKTVLADHIKQAGERGVNVQIDAAAEVRFETVKQVIEICKQAGARSVSLGATEIDPAAK